MTEEEAKRQARQLLQIADTDLEKVWKEAPYTFGGSSLGLTIGSRDNGVAYIKIAAEWLASASSVLSYLNESDQDPLIDQLSNRVSQVIARRQKLTDLGLDMGDPISEALETFVKDVIARIKKFFEVITSPPAVLGMIGVVLILVAILVLKR